MNTDKKLTILRIMIFVIISYGIIIACVMAFGYMEDTAAYKIFGTFGIAFAPAAANYLTRLITKEGFKDPLYAANFRGNIKYYILAAVVPVIAYIISPIIVGKTFIEGYSISSALNGDTAAEFVYIILKIVSLSILVFPLYFGEEYGWRAYLTPKLEAVMNKPTALIVSGIIWGMWHAPIVYMGHNFGTSYSFYPWGGYIAMSVFCIFVGCLFTWLTEKTGSIYPACICHSVHNNIANVMLSFFVAGSFTEESFLSQQFYVSITNLLPMAVLCIPFMILLLCGRNKKAV